MFGKLRRRRTTDDELGRGVWRQDHDRFARAVDRFYSVVTGIDADRGKPDGTCLPRESLAALTLELNDAADWARRICAEGQRRSPTDGMTLPGGNHLADVQRELSRAGTAAAQAAQGAFLVRAALRAADASAQPTGADAGPASRAVAVAVRHLGAAEELLHGTD